MLGFRDFVGLPGERAAVWDKTLKMDAKEFHNKDIYKKRMQIKEDYLKLTKGKLVRAPVEKIDKKKGSMNATSHSSSISYD